MEIIGQVKISGARKINSLSDISDNSRLFYELGHYVVLRRYTDKEGNICEDRKWIREGIFKEIDNVVDFIKTDKRMSEKEFIEHHNFVVVD
jgi:hypothetical protein